ncbi:MAG: MoaD/ThiS family protein [Thermoproteota archaeon]
MKLSVKFMGSYQVASGTEELPLRLEGTAKVKNAIKKISEELPGIKKLLDTTKFENLASHTLILLNGQEIGVLKGLETPLDHGDELVLIPVSHGG